ncbi:hypothetical protein RCL1_006959 [Eukaryota sp. TZLM3-RCL]
MQGENARVRDLTGPGRLVVRAALISLAVTSVLATHFLMFQNKYARLLLPAAASLSVANLMAYFQLRKGRTFVLWLLIAHSLAWIGFASFCMYNNLSSQSKIAASAVKIASNLAYALITYVSIYEVQHGTVRTKEPMTPTARIIKEHVAKTKSEPKRTVIAKVPEPLSARPVRRTLG